MDSSWLLRRTTALETIVSVYEPAYRVPAALKRRLESFAQTVEREADGGELWCWRRPSLETDRPEGLAIVKRGKIVRSWRIAR